MEKSTSAAIEKVTTTAITLTGDDIIELLKKGNARLFKDATAELAMFIAGRDMAIEHGDLLIVKVTQTQRRAK